MDQVEIADEDLLYRRVHPTQVELATGRVTSAAFKGSGGHELSVDLARLTTAETCFNWAVQRQRKCAGVVQFSAGLARTLQQEVRHDPLPNDHPEGPNPAHTLVIGEKDIKPKPTVATRLADGSTWVYPEK